MRPPGGTRHLTATLGDPAHPGPHRCSQVLSKADAQMPRGAMAAPSPQADFTPSLCVKAPSGMVAAMGRKGVFLPLLPSCQEACARFGGPGGCGEAWGPEGPPLLQDLSFSRDKGPWGGGFRPTGLRSFVGLGRRQVSPSPDQRPLFQHSPQNAAKEAMALVLLPRSKCPFSPQCFIFSMCYQF